MKNDSNDKTRRDFLKTMVGATAGLFLASLSLEKFSFAEEKKKKKEDSAPVAELPADPKKGKAKEFHYTPDHSLVTDAKLKVEKLGVPFDKQNCKNCLLFKLGKNGTGTCTLMIAEPEHIVKEMGWCTSWAKNPAVPV